MRKWAVNRLPLIEESWKEFGTFYLFYIVNETFYAFWPKLIRKTTNRSIRGQTFFNIYFLSLLYGPLLGGGSWPSPPPNVLPSLLWCLFLGGQQFQMRSTLTWGFFFVLPWRVYAIRTSSNITICFHSSVFEQLVCFSRSEQEVKVFSCCQF